jgi:hypothetical protein
MKVTRKLKVFVLGGYNVAWFLLSAIWFIEDAPVHGDLDSYLRRRLLLYLAEAGSMTLVFWYLLRTGERSNRQTQTGAVEKTKNSGS